MNLRQLRDDLLPLMMVTGRVPGKPHSVYELLGVECERSK